MRGFHRIYQDKSGDLVIKEVAKEDQSAYECLGYGPQPKQKPQSYVGFLKIASMFQNIALYRP